MGGILPTKPAATCADVLAELERLGLLLLADVALPSVTGLVAGGPVRGSWWGHPQGQAIFRVAEELGDHADVLAVKLIAGKVTFVHRRLWPALLAVAGAGERWQTSKLSAAARALWKRVIGAGLVRTDEPAKSPRPSSGRPGEAARELEKKLLVLSSQIHTETGAHAKVLETWEHWARRTGFAPEQVPVAETKAILEEAALQLAGKAATGGRLPWQPGT